MAPMLEVKDIHCDYDGAPVIHGLSLEVMEGEIVAILGSNGAGKTTTMHTICGLKHPSRGEILFRGEDITKNPASANIKKGIAYVPEGRRLFPKLSVQENLQLGAFSIDDRSIIDERLEEMYVLFPRLKDRRNQTAETLSGGEQQMCAIARGLMCGPQLIMLDELSLGLMPTLVERVFETVVEINKRGITILMVEQQVQEALEIAHRGYVLQTGQVVLSGSSRELLDSDEFRKAYMGI